MDTLGCIYHLVLSMFLSSSFLFFFCESSIILCYGQQSASAPLKATFPCPDDLADIFWLQSVHIQRQPSDKENSPETSFPLACYGGTNGCV